MSEKSNNRGLIYIGHLPHGFYEDQLRGYFNQFGKVTNARVVRSPKTGRSRGYGFVEFEHVDVARIAAETMDNYLMFKRRLVAKFVPEEEKKGLFMRKAWSTTSYPRKYSRAKEKQRQNGVRLAKSTKTLKKRVKRKIEQLKELGVEHSVRAVMDDGVTEKLDQ